MGLNNILLIVLFALTSTATCQVFKPEGQAKNREFKYLVYITLYYNFPDGLFPPNYRRISYAGGVIVNEKWIVTCAHNFDDEEVEGNYYRVNKVTVLAGTKDKTSKSRAQEKSVGIENVIIHGHFRRPSSAADIALIFLGDNSFSFNGRVQPANFIKSGVELALHSECAIVGWGAYVSHRQKYREVDPLVARKGKLYTVDSGYCRRCLNKRGEQTHFYDGYHLCIGCKNCTGCSLGTQGDSGSPVVQQIGGTETVVGLMRGGGTEYPKKCGIYHPGFAVKLSVHRNWMNRKIKEREKRHADERAQNNMTSAAVAVASVAATFFVNRRFR